MGGLYLVYLGIKAFLTVPQSKHNSAKYSGLVSSYISTYFLTLTNPMTVLSFAAIFAGFGLGKNGGNYTDVGALVAGVFIGLIRQRFTPSHLRWVKRISGCIIIGFGFHVLAGLSHCGFSPQRLSNIDNSVFHHYF